MEGLNAWEVFTQAVDHKGLKTENVRRGSMKVQCPVHDDDNPSMKADYRDGKVMLYCHGCQADVRDIVAALDLDMGDLFDEEPDRKNNRTLIKEYRYEHGVTGEYLFSKFRYFPKTFAIGTRKPEGGEQWGMPKGVQEWLYHAPLLKAAFEVGSPIWLVEGEADVHSVEAMGGTATTAPHGAGHGKWKDFHTDILRRASEVRIVVDLDDDQEDGKNIGRDYAFEVRDRLVAAGIPVTLWRSPVGKDASDALSAGKGLDDFVRYDLGRERPDGIIGSELEAKEFKPLVFAVEGILPQGVAILAASPKAGKSWLTLDFAIGVATGGVAMSYLACTQGDVLYVGLEDSERRLQSRINLLQEGREWPNMDRIEFQTIDSGWVGGQQGMAFMAEWAETVDDPRLIVIDTLRKAEPDLDEARNQYIAEQETMLRYKRFADRYDLTVLFVHHNNKAKDEGDWLDKFSGSKGLTGGADTLLYIDYKRGERQGRLCVDGRDVESDNIDIVKPHGRPFWTATRAPDSLAGAGWAPSARVALTGRQEAILDLCSEAGLSVESLAAAFPDDVEGAKADAAYLVEEGLAYVNALNILVAL